MDLLGRERTTATYCTTPVEGALYFDVLTMSLTEISGFPHLFSHAVLLFGESRPDACAADPGYARRLNVEATIQIIGQLDDAGVVPVFLSTEAVFDGRQGGYVESDRPGPLYLYSRQKHEVEQFLEKRRDNGALIFRLARVFGSQPGDGTLFTKLLDQIRKARPFFCAGDQLFSPVHVQEVAQLVACAMQRNLRGLYHLAGPRPISRREALEMVIQSYRRTTGQEPEVLVTFKPLRDFSTLEPRPLDVSMKPDKILAATGLTLQTPEVWCRRIVADAMARHV